MGYRILLFDVDNTLLDFDANEEESFRSMMAEMRENWTEEIYDTYKKINSGIWKQIEKKEITVEEGVNRRFSDLMFRYGKTVDGQLWEKTYRKYLNQGIQEIPGVHQVLRELKEKGLWFVCADMGGTCMYDLKLTGPIGMVIGNEGEGVGRRVREACDMTAAITMRGQIESLNASVAAGVLAYEILRQRLQAAP